MKLTPLLFGAAFVSLTLAAEAALKPAYTLGIPKIKPVFVSYSSESEADPTCAAWAETNSAFVAYSGVYYQNKAMVGLPSPESYQDVSGRIVHTPAIETGFVVERAKPMYYLGDRLIPPSDVDWRLTYETFQASSVTNNFLFDTKNNVVYVTLGETVQFPWVVTHPQTGEVSTNEYLVVAAPMSKERPKNIFWTDPEYGGRTVDVSGKFVKFYGPQELLTKTVKEVPTGTTVNGQQATREVVESGLYIEESGGKRTIYAAGKLTGQVVMAYYDSGSFDRIVDVQTLEISQPQTIVCKSTVGSELKPTGRGYSITGLVATPTTLDDFDDMGPFLYQHKGLYPYSPKNGSVFALRPSDEKTRNQTQIYWMETDRQGVKWPFEVDEYLVSWPEDAMKFVRGDSGAQGRGVVIPKAYTAELMKWQEDADGSSTHHARNVVDGEFFTYGAGKSLLKVKAQDNIWFLPVESILRTDETWFDLSLETEARVGEEVRFRGGSLEGLAPGREMSIDVEIPGCIFEARSDSVWNANIYDPYGTAADGLKSVVYPVTAPTDGSAASIEVWWFTRFQSGDMPEPIEVPSLPQRYSVVWPKLDEAPQITLSSQLGSAGYSTFRDGAAIVFDSERANVKLPNRKYFSSRGGSVLLWTKALSEEAQDRDSALVCMHNREGERVLSLNVVGNSFVAKLGDTELQIAAADLPIAQTNWCGLAFSWDDKAVTFLVCDSYCKKVVSAPMTAEILQALSVSMRECRLGANGIGGDSTACPGRVVDEFQTWRKTLAEGEMFTVLHTWVTGSEADLSCYISVDAKTDELEPDGKSNKRYVIDRVLNTKQEALECLKDSPGAPHAANAIVTSDSPVRLYRQTDPSTVGYNPNEEHAFVEKSETGYIIWALRCDLNRAGKTVASEPGVLVEYERNGRRLMQFFHVRPTSLRYPTFADYCTAGLQLPGPKPLTMMVDPWLKETYWDPNSLPPFKDRKNQVWARCEGVFDIYMYYAQQPGFDWPEGMSTPKVGDAVAWLAYLTENDDRPQPWRWSVSWPTDAPEMKITQMLTTAVNGLPEMWNASSMAVVYPAENVEDVVRLTDPTAARSVDLGFRAADLADIGLKVGPGQKLHERKGLWYFEGVSPSLSQRVYVDPSNDTLVLKGVKENNPGGVELLYVNVLVKEDVDSLRTLVRDAPTGDTLNKFMKAIDALAELGPLEPTSVAMRERDGHTQPVATYVAPDHYALTAMGMTNWVVTIENDATNDFCSAGNPINMHVIKVIPEYDTGRVVTRQDPNNLLSQVLGIHYSNSLAGKADEYIFDWRRAAPNANGTIPTEYDNTDVYKQQFDDEQGTGLTSFAIGLEGDTLVNLVNAYYICRFRAKDESSSAWKVMGDKWSDWMAPPALAEGWVQRVLNNVTPFTQRMTDLYENEAETAVSWMQQAGKPYTGDVALNQDNLTSVGLIELYRTILNKAESMSLKLKINDPEANKQLLLAVERLADLYGMLGDEAYSDAANPTIGFGSNFGEIEEGLKIDYGAASSSLFAFDNQVPTLLDEELALLRGRSCVNAPGNTIGPYYNRLVWNFTKGITAGEVAYAVNYNISGRKTSTLTASTAAELYPQGHGDAYGHYLSALQGWYHLLGNPYFSWGVPAMGEMNVADNVVNVDYYDEAKFAETAASVARAANRTVELTAVKQYRDTNSESGSDGYLDADSNSAFGYGEWASRGAYGALCNWAVANSLLPETSLTDTNGVSYADQGLLHIDRSTVSALTEIAQAVESIQQTVDRLDAGENPLGLDQNAVPFDLTPLGSADQATHYEQIRERARGAFDNAKRILDRAQEYSNRLRLLEESRAGIVDNLDQTESDLTAELIAIYGRPYSDDVGPGKTYPQDYYGPDLYHYMWMNIKAYGFDKIEDTVAHHNITYKIVDYNTDGTIKTLSPSNLTEVDRGTLSYSLSSNGLVLKPDSIRGERPAVGELQLAYADFLAAYGNFQGSITTYEQKKSSYEIERNLAMAQVKAAENLGATVKKVYDGSDNLKKYIEKLSDSKKALAAMDATLEVTKLLLGAGSSITANVGLSTTIGGDANKFGVATAIIATVNVIATGVKAGLEGTIADCEGEISKLNGTMEKAEKDYAEIADSISNWERLIPATEDLTAAVGNMEGAFGALQAKQEAVLAILQKGSALQEKRELLRQQAVNNIAKMRYNDTFFRKLRNETLSKYDAAFRIAQTYAFLAAKAYCYETGSSLKKGTVGDDLLRQIVGARALGETDANGNPIVSANGDAGLAGALAKLDANWAVSKTQLGINNPQPYATWFSLRHGLFRILSDETGDDAWKAELSKYWVDDIQTAPDFVRHCQPFASQFGLADQEPGLIIPFETTIDFAKNLFGKDLAFDDAQFDSSYFATKIAAAGVWFEGYNEKRAGYVGSGAFATTPNVYLVPVGTDKMRAPGADGEEVVDFEVVDQTIPVPNPLTTAEIEESNRLPLYTDGEFGGVDAVTRIRRHPSFRAYYGKSGESPNDLQLDATRLVGRSVWNTKWMLVIPAGTLNADREAALSVFIRGLDTDRDGVLDIKPVRDIRIGFKTYSHSGK